MRTTNYMYRSAPKHEEVCFIQLALSLSLSLSLSQQQTETLQPTCVTNSMCMEPDNFFTTNGDDMKKKH
jgi:hypothetical protein